MPPAAFLLFTAYMLISGAGIVWFATVRYKRLLAMTTSGTSAQAEITRTYKVPRNPDLLAVEYRFQSPQGEEKIGRSIAARTEENILQYEPGSGHEIVYLPEKPSSNALIAELPAMVKSADRFRKVILVSQVTICPLLIGLLWYCVLHGQAH